MRREQREQRRTFAHGLTGDDMAAQHRAGERREERRPLRIDGRRRIETREDAELQEGGAFTDVCARVHQHAVDQGIPIRRDLDQEPT